MNIKKITSAVCALLMATNICTAFADVETEANVVTDGELVQPIELPFTDVTRNDDYYDAVSYVYENKIMKGVETALFGPAESLDRAMVVTILHRMENEPVVNYALSFTDLEEDGYYVEAVRWAQSTGIVKGMSDEEFAPYEHITREQLAAIIYRYAIDKGVDVNAAVADTNTLSYNDITDIAEYASPAVHFCLATDILKASEDNMIMPAADATRAQTAMALYNYAKLVEAAPTVEEKDLTGTYADSVSGRATMEIAKTEDGAYAIAVRWSSSAAEYTQWTMTATLEDNKLSYTDCVVKDITCDEDGKETETVKDENGEGYFTLADDTLLWDGAKDENCRELVFSLQENLIGMPNPMVPTDAEEIANKLGFKFVLPEGAENAGYVLIEDLAEVVFTLDDVLYCGRIKATDKLEDISGMYCDWTSEEECKIGTNEGKVMRSVTDTGYIDVCLWYEAAPGITHSLTATAADLDGFDITAIANQMNAPTQGDAE